MVADRYRRFEVDDRVMQLMGPMIFWSPKSIGTQRQANELVIVRYRVSKRTPDASASVQNGSHHAREYVPMSPYHSTL